MNDFYQNLNHILLWLPNFGSIVHNVLVEYSVPVGLPIVAILLIFLILSDFWNKGKLVAPNTKRKPASAITPEHITPPAINVEPEQTPATEIDFDIFTDTRHSILVVDDSLVVRDRLSKLLTSNGFRVELAKDGLEAIDKIATGFYAVMITDIEMPNMTGLELISHIQGNIETEDLPIIAITGHEELQARARDYQGLFGIFPKPWNDRELLKRVNTLTSLRRKP